MFEISKVILKLILKKSKMTEIVLASTFLFYFKIIKETQNLTPSINK